MSSSYGYSNIKEATLNIKKQKISLGTINPRGTSKSALQTNAKDIKEKMLETISKLEQSINASVKSKINDYVRIENTLQETIPKRDPNKLILVNTYDRLTKKRANDVRPLKITTHIPVSLENKGHQKTYSTIWGNPKKLDGNIKLLENVVPRNIRLDKIGNQSTREFLIKTVDHNEKTRSMNKCKTSVGFYNQKFLTTRKDFTDPQLTGRDTFYNDNSMTKNLSLTMLNTNYQSNKVGSATFRETSKNLSSTKILSSMRSTRGKLFCGKTTKPRIILSKEARKNPFFDKQVLVDDDLNSGLFNLINQGLIPKDLDVGPVIDRDDPILNTKKIQNQQFKKHEITVENMHLTNTFLITKPCEFFADLGLETKFNTKTRGFLEQDLSRDSKSNNNILTKIQINFILF